MNTAHVLKRRRQAWQCASAGRNGDDRNVMHVRVVFQGANIPNWRPRRFQHVVARIVRGRVSRRTSWLGIDLWGSIGELHRVLQGIRNSFKNVEVLKELQAC